MTRNFIFGLGVPSDLASRVLTISNIDREAVVEATDTLGGAAEVSSEIVLGLGRFKAVLVDTRNDGTNDNPQSIVFDGNCTWPSHEAGDGSHLRIISIEDNSSSSSSSSSNSSSSSSASSSSSSSSSQSSSSSSSS